MRPNARQADRGQDRGAAEGKVARTTRPEGEITGVAAAGSPFAAAPAPVSSPGGA